MADQEERTAGTDAGARAELRYAGKISSLMGRGGVLDVKQADVNGVRERHRRRRLTILGVILFVPFAFLWYRIVVGRPFNLLQLPHFSETFLQFYAPVIFIGIILTIALLFPLIGAGRSPHILYKPEQIDVTLDDVKGLEQVRSEVIRTLNVFLGYATFRKEMGGTPRRGLLFEGPPGTGKTHMAKAMARHAGVPFLFVSGPSFQSMFYGMTARKIRKFFKDLKKTARREGGAIGFIEEIDAFATKRGGMAAATPASGNLAGMTTNATVSEGTGGVVNELLVQMQSFDDPPPLARFVNRIKDLINQFLPMHRALKKKPTTYANVLVIAATNRGDMLDPGLLRPGRFDRRLYFDVPSRQGRRELIDHFLSRKSHAPELDDPAVREDLAGMTFGYTPVMIEHLLDESLIEALRRGRDAMTLHDITDAKLLTEIGLPNAVAYTPDERRQIATHEAGHAVAAYLAGHGRKLEVLSIVKRRDALGLLGHSEAEERFTKTRTELEAMLKISLGGMSAEEIFEGESGTGPAGDLAYATNLAAEMIGSLGLGGSLVSFRAVGDTVFDPGLVGRVLANGEARRAVDELLKRQKKDVKELIESHKNLVLALRDALLERDELIGDQIIQVLEAAGGRVQQRRGAGASGTAASSAR